MSVSAMFRPTRAWTYANTTHERYLLNYEAGLELNSHLAIAVGYLSDASALKDDGIQSNYSLFDANTATGYVDILISI
jgi:hypothetical protein